MCTECWKIQVIQNRMRQLFDAADEPLFCMLSTALLLQDGTHEQVLLTCPV